MEEYDINGPIQGCASLKHKFLCVLLKPNSFLIVNAATTESFGNQWLLLCQKEEEDQLFFADPLGPSNSSYRDLYQRIISLEENAKIYQLLNDQPNQCKNSKLSALFCIYIAHYIFNSQKIVKLSDAQLIRFAFHKMS